MKNKKLIKNIKSDVKKQIESDIKNSIVKELKNSSNKQIKKLRKQILAEVKEEMFGVSKKQTNNEVKNIVETEVENTRLKELYGIDFDKKRMGALVTGQLDKVKNSSDKLPESLRELLNREKNQTHINANPYNKTTDDRMMEMLPTQGGNYSSAEPSLFFPNRPPNLDKEILNSRPNIEDMMRKMSESSFGKTMVKVPSTELTSEKKEELTFFLGKLKEGVSKLREDEKNIDYRKKTNGLYSFSFDRKANFDLKFDIDLNMNTYEAKVQLFDFKIDGLKFDKKSVELLDIVEVLDMSGMNLNKYINEINGINEIDIDSVKIPTTKVVKVEGKPKPTSKRLGIDKFIEDEKIVSLLNKNEISNLGQLLSVDDLTSLKGVGTKTVEKINKYLKSNIHGVL